MILPQISGYTRQDGRHANVAAIAPVPPAALAEGVTVGDWCEAGDARVARLTLTCTAKSGSNPTLDVTVQTSDVCSGANVRTVGTFAQKTNAAALAMTAVTAAGTSPPTTTLTGTPAFPVNLRVECLVAGARGTWTGRYSLDGGTNYTAFTSAATVAMVDGLGRASGVTLNFANTAAAIDNVWTAGHVTPGLVMSAVTSAGTTPPAITISGTQLLPVPALRVECTTLGARATAVIRYSCDGGVTWVSDVATAATIAVIDPAGNDTGLVLNYANAAAAVDNVWTAVQAGYERKSFAGLDKFFRCVMLVGGSGTPTVTAGVSGELV